MRRLSTSLLIVFCCLNVLPVAAQDDARSLPDSVWLEGLQQHWQQYNRCSAAALTIQLSYFDWGGSHTQTARRLNPNPGDVSVRIEEMAAFAEEQGLRAIVRTGGAIDLLIALVAGGFPILIETAYYNASDSYDDWMSHNRVVMGYEAWPTELLYVFDPLMGNGPDDRGRAMPFYEFDARWQHFNRDYLVIYRPAQEERLKSILGPHWDLTYNAEWTLQQAQADRVGSYQDAFSILNLASAQVALGLYEEAAANFDEARALGLPKRTFWYRFEIFEAYLAVGRYEDVVSLVYEVLDGSREVEEMYYYIGRAYEGQGNVDRAGANYSAALHRNPNFTEANQALAVLG